MSLYRQRGFSHLAQARRHLNAALRKDGVDIGKGRESEVDCYAMCSHCGRLHRADACPNCGGLFNVDLGVEQNFYYLVDDENEAPTRMRSRRRQWIGGFLGAGACLAALAGFVGASSALWVPAMLGGPVLLLASATRGWAPQLNVQTRPRPAARWIGPTGELSDALEGAPTFARGPVRPTESLEAPFSRLPCAAYVASVRDEKGKVLFEEHANASAEVGGEYLARNTAWVGVGQHRVLDARGADERLRKWCRARGIRSLGRSLQFFEGRVEALAPVCGRRKGSALRLELATGPRAGRQRLA